MTTSILSANGLSKSFGGHAALADIDLQVEQGEFIALLGPSGCGKTTLLRCIAGFLKPDAGSISIAGEDVTALAPYHRPLNTVFQNYALFPHMSVVENVAYGPRRKGAPRAEAMRRAEEALDLVGLTGFADRMPARLSGGQQQRVALARAIVNRPKLLLLDEPLSALDLKLRKKVQRELKQLQEKLGIAFLFVTHDQEEAMSMADRIVLMNRGKIEQIGRGPDIYRKPATRFAADFIGEANLLPVKRAGEGGFTLFDGAVSITNGSAPHAAKLLGIVRPEDVAIVTDQALTGLVTVLASVEDIVHIGSHGFVTLRTNGCILISRTTPDTISKLVPGATVHAGFRSTDVHIIAEQAP